LICKLEAFEVAHGDGEGGRGMEVAVKGGARSGVR